MLLESVVRDLDFTIVKGNLDVKVESIAYDSREAKNNSLFIAISGFVVDGHDFITKAIQKGSTVIVVEKDIQIDSDITVLKVPDTRDAMALIGANFYHNPTKDFNLIGITGTNGKTSTTYFIKSIFEQAKRSIGLIGTIGTVINNNVTKNKNTTPESLDLQKIFADMVEAKSDNCIMEVSSHALSLKRVAHSSFNMGIYTNLTPDHLELHNTMEEYFEAKAMLFDLTSDYNIVNADDEYGQKLMKRIEKYDTELITYGIDTKAEIYATNINYSFEHTTFTVQTPKGKFDVKVNLPGKIYVYNSLAAIACAYCAGIEVKDIQAGIRNVEGIKGRLEVIYKEDDYRIVVDFAHTEDSLEKALTTLRPYTKGKIILVFGVYAPGDKRGLSKRRSMGKVAAKYADFSVVTSDNPKEYDPNLIIDEISESIDEETSSYNKVLDREEAIKFAIDISEKGDTILIAGKGHETAQIIGKEEIPFNETEIVEDFMNQRAKTRERAR
ncbi:UDP-N-acetylmuramoyl-L-alanyl-D-glutamate--2,6-diaminopimelate ligase [Virgibacillus oceani]|uniref:UDP-N-acetylmuramyl-tripeptide synthetase n=1 Tax=Virgibacillus oceani TaxID=1479511 RepID=A0A917M8R1_9BACI|nr:UDP-N-acetylmuramoyl-L-alanyl-D-glutamate--2,6-diaminopimelate ligase [Virgibacillus oceani]GGG82436.1 UDP-N-acetylmuramoyl-L-alanyl-D-glutamate--2,6-diaminopimelate ligase [Virgibacillus oceani]